MSKLIWRMAFKLYVFLHGSKDKFLAAHDLIEGQTYRALLVSAAELTQQTESLQKKVDEVEATVQRLTAKINNTSNGQQQLEERFNTLRTNKEEIVESMLQHIEKERLRSEAFAEQVANALEYWRATENHTGPDDQPGTVDDGIPF